jgi:hypothetical protein
VVRHTERSNCFARNVPDALFRLTGSGVDSGAANNGTPQIPTVAHCVGQALKKNGVSVALDIVGAIPAVGNAASAATGIVRAGIAINHVVTNPAFGLASGTYGAVTGLSDEAPYGAASAATGLGLAGADLALGGTKAIPIVGNALSVLTGAYDIYQGVKTYQQCMAGGG